MHIRILKGDRSADTANMIYLIRGCYKKYAKIWKTYMKLTTI